MRRSRPPLECGAHGVTALDVWKVSRPDDW